MSWIRVHILIIETIHYARRNLSIIFCWQNSIKKWRQNRDSVRKWIKMIVWKFSIFQEIHLFQTLEYIHTNGVYDINLFLWQFSCAPIHHIAITPIKLYFTSARLRRCTGPTDSPVQKYSGLRCLILCQRFSDSCIL